MLSAVVYDVYSGLTPSGTSSVHLKPKMGATDSIFGLDRNIRAGHESFREKLKLCFKGI
jgi:hypothetical protein